MPYRWTVSKRREVLKLWPHNALPARGFASVIFGFFTLALLPLLTVLGSAHLWSILPFTLLTLGGIWVALRYNFRTRRILEELTLTKTQASLTRYNPDGSTQGWSCNRHWARVELLAEGGPVPCYVTLGGGPRRVEIGAFLSEKERQSLYRDLTARLTP